MILSEKIISFALSRSGILVRKGATYVVGAATAAAVIPTVDAPTIERGLVSGGMALLTLLYAYFEKWVTRKRSERVAMEVHKAWQSNPNKEKIGNETFEAFTKRTGIPIARAEPR